jgi:alpha-glucosidase
MPMDFMFCTVDKLSPADFRAQIANAESTGGWPVYVISNHDMTRSYNRYGDGKHNDQIAKLMAGMYLTLRGTPIMYYGEELGMENNDPVRKEDVKDPIGIAGWPKEKGRDGERTPMQWNDSPYAGFSPTRPWLPVPASFKTHNVDSELADPNSILQFYKRLLALRHHEPALLYGDYVALNQDNPNVLSYLRRYKNEAVLVVLNMSATAQQINFNLSEQGISSAKATTLLTSSANASSGQLDQVTLEPFEVYIARVSQ